MSERLGAVAEETLLTLLDADAADGADAERSLRVTASKQDGRAVLEFVAAARGENIEDRLAVLDEPTADRPVERDISLRLLQHYATLQCSTSSTTNSKSSPSTSIRRLDRIRPASRTTDSRAGAGTAALTRALAPGWPTAPQP